MREEAPRWIYDACDHFRRELFSAYALPRIDIYLDDMTDVTRTGNSVIIAGSYATMHAGKDRTAPMTMVLDRTALAIEHMASMGSICHELSHGAAPFGAGHGVEWRAIMTKIGLTPVQTDDGWEERPVRDGLFWQSYHRLPEVQQAVKLADNERHNAHVRPISHDRTGRRPERDAAPSIWIKNLPKDGWVFYLDTSGSMNEGVNTTSGRKSRFQIAQKELSNVFTNFPGARLFTFEEFGPAEFSSPEEVTPHSGNALDDTPNGGSTSFHKLFEGAQRIGARRIFIISDGGLIYPGRPGASLIQATETVEEVMAARANAIASGVELISVHYIGHATNPRDEGDRKFLRSLCYGGGRMTIGEQPQEMAAAIGAPHMPDRYAQARRAPSAPVGRTTATATPRARPNYEPEVRASMEAVQSRTAVNKHIADLGEIVGNVAHQLSVLEDRFAILDTERKLLATADKLAAQVFAQQQAQLTADQQNNEAGSAQLRAGLQQVGGQIGNAMQQIFTGIAQQHAASIAAARDTSAPVQIGNFSIDPGVFERAAAMLPSRSATALPSPSGNGYGQVGRAPSPAALPAPDASRAVAVVQPRAAVPVRRTGNGW